MICAKMQCGMPLQGRIERDGRDEQSRLFSFQERKVVLY